MYAPMTYAYQDPEVLADVDPEDPDRIVVRSSLVIQDQVNLLPGSRWDKKRHVHTIPKSWALCKALSGLFPQVQVGPVLWQWATEWRQVVVDPSLAIRSALDVQGEFDPRLYSYQKAGVAWLALVERALLGDEMGTGKTVQSIMALRRLWEYGHDIFPVVCIVPSSTKYPWAEHWAEWFPESRPIVVDGTKPKRKAALEEAAAVPGAVAIINWESVRLHSRLAPYGSIRLSEVERTPAELNLIPWRSVIADEVHRMKDPTSKQTRATWAVQHGSRVRYRFGLTGTPIGDHPGDLWAIMHGLAPEEYPTRTEHADRYCLQTFSVHDGKLKIVGLQPATRAEFFSFFDVRFRRMPKELVLPYLPPIVNERREAPMTPKQKKAYEELSQDGFVWLDDDDAQLLVADDKLARQTRLLQLSSAMCSIDEHGTVQLTEPSSKLDVLDEILEETHPKPIVVTAVHRKLLMLATKRLDKAGIPYRLIVGGMSAAQKESSRQDFMRGQARVLLFTMAAGGEGLDMTAADTIVFLQRSWSLIQNLQAEARVHRIGAEAHGSVTMIDVVTPGTREQKLYQTYRAKNARLQEIVRDKATMLQAPTITPAVQARLDELERERLAILAADDLSQELTT